MDEAEARRILGDWIHPDDSIEHDGLVFVNWTPSDLKAGLTGDSPYGFTSAQLHAIAWWMDNKGKVR